MISWPWHHKETLEQKGRINGTIRSNLHSRDIPKGFGSVFPLEFVSKCRLYDYIILWYINVITWADLFKCHHCSHCVFYFYPVLQLLEAMILPCVYTLTQWSDVISTPSKYMTTQESLTYLHSLPCINLVFAHGKKLFRYHYTSDGLLSILCDTLYDYRGTVHSVVVLIDHCTL